MDREREQAMKQSIEIRIKSLKREIDWLKELSEALKVKENSNGFKLIVSNMLEDLPSACINSQEGREELKALIENERWRKERLVQEKRDLIKSL